MTALSNDNPTLTDLAASLDPQGAVAKVVEMLNQTNEILADMTVMEGNLQNGHKSVIRTGLPTPTWRKLYGGVQPTKSTRVPVVDSCGMLEAYAECDKALADMSGDLGAFLLSESKPHIEAMGQTVSSTLFTGNELTAPETFTGFAPRYNDLTTAQSKDNIVSGASTHASENASIYLVVWSPETVTGITPKGSKAGLSVTDKGLITIENVDGAGGRMEAYRTHFKWDIGLCVRDWRYVVRIANINRNTLKGDAASGAKLLDLMDDAIDRVPSLSMGRPAFYMDRELMSFFRRQAKASISSSTLNIEQQRNGIPMMTYMGIPVRRVDALNQNETLVS